MESSEKGGHLGRMTALHKSRLSKPGLLCGTLRLSPRLCVENAFNRRARRDNAEYRREDSFLRELFVQIVARQCVFSEAVK